MKSVNKSKNVFKFILEKFGLHRRRIVFVSIVAVIGALLTVAVPYVYGRMFDLALVKSTSFNLLLFFIFMWLSLNLVSGVLTNLTSAWGDVLGYEISVSAETDAYSNWIFLPVSFHKDKKKGEILNKITRGSWEFQQLTAIIFRIFPEIVILIFSLVLMAFIKWRLFLIFLFFIVVYFLVTSFRIRKIISHVEKMNSLWNRLYGVVYDRLYNVFLIKSFANEEEESKNIKSLLLQRSLVQYKEMSYAWRNLYILQKIIYGSAFVFVLGTAIFFLRLGTITPGEFIMFFGYVNLAFNPFYQLNEFYRFFKNASVAMKRMKELEEMSPEFEGHGDKILKNVVGNIEFKDVSFGYKGGRSVLESISFGANAGESLAIVGESGVGKTTLVEILAGYYKLDSGNIFLDGVDISKLKLSWLREQMAIVSQDISLFNESLEKNIKYAKLDASRNEIIEACKSANAHEFILKLPKGYDTIVGERGVKLSAGQKQRISIAMAFLKNPKILILDEPTSALDAVSEMKVSRGIKELVRERTTFIIAHRLSTVRDVNKIVVLHNKKVKEVGTHNELIKKRGIYYNFYKLQRGLG